MLFAYFEGKGGGVEFISEIYANICIIIKIFIISLPHR